MKHAHHQQRAVAIAAQLWPANAGPLPTIRVKAIRRGHAHTKKRSITMPVWVFEAPHTANNPLVTEANGADYLIYYIAHELAHILTTDPGHGPGFQARCHELAGSLYFFEQGYKPKCYAAEMRRAARFDSPTEQLEG